MQDATPHEIGLALLITTSLIIYIAIVLKLAETFDEDFGIILFIGLLLPLVVGGFILV